MELKQTTTIIFTSLYQTMPDSCLLDMLFDRSVRAVSVPRHSKKQWLVGLLKPLSCWMQIKQWLETRISLKQNAKKNMRCLFTALPETCSWWSVEKYLVYPKENIPFARNEITPFQHIYRNPLKSLYQRVLISPFFQSPLSLVPVPSVEIQHIGFPK